MQQILGSGNEADVVFLTNEKTVIFNNPLRVRIADVLFTSYSFSAPSIEIPFFPAGG